MPRPKLTAKQRAKPEPPQQDAVAAALATPRPIGLFGLAGLIRSGATDNAKGDQDVD